MPDDDSSSEEVEFTGGDEEEEEYAPVGNANDDDDDGDDEPLSKLGKRASRGAPVSYAEDDDDDDDSDDDDIPLASLVQNKKKPATSPKKTTNGNKQKKKAATRTSPKKKKAKTNNKTTTSTPKTKKAPPKKSSSAISTSSSSKNYEWASAALYGTDSTKGLLIQRLLCRWWYAITWPDPTKLPAKAPKYYDSLDGFPGVYVCTSAAGDEPVGHILDLRKDDPENKPCFENFAKKSASELQDLLLRALENQLSKLKEVEGPPGTTTSATEKELHGLIKWTKKVNPTKADKEAIKVLKAYNLEL